MGGPGGAALRGGRAGPGLSRSARSTSGSRWTTGSTSPPRSTFPTRPATAPSPRVLESIPYRKDDWTLSRDWPLHGAFAAAGYASCRLDVRGTGSSRGIADDEYTEREILDNLAVIDWLASRPGAAGPVGMFGISWGGFSALQAAMRRPPALRAIIPACFSHDRYHVDVHWWGGTRLIGESVYWPVEMVGENALPPDPERFGPGWREEWLRRLDATPQWPFSSLRHQRRDAHWRHGSAIEDWGSIEAATLALGGLSDSYRDSVLAVVANVRAPGPRDPGPVGPRLAARRGAGADDRRRGPHDPLVGPLAQGRAERDRRGAGPDALRGRAGRARTAFPVAVAPAEVPGRWWAIGRWPSVLRIAPPPPLHLGGDGAAGLGTLDERPPDRRRRRPTRGPAGRPWRWPRPSRAPAASPRAGRWTSARTTPARSSTPASRSPSPS